MSPLTEWLSALESSAPATALRGSVWAYPMVNAGHIGGVSLLIGAIIPLDLRLLGLWSTTPLAPLWRVLTRTAAVGLGLAVIFGFILFAVRATDYTGSSLFVPPQKLIQNGNINIFIFIQNIQGILMAHGSRGIDPHQIASQALAELDTGIAISRIGP